MINNIKKSIFLLFLLVFVGITNVSAATKNIEVTNIEVKDKSGTITVVDPVFESNEVKSNITFNQIDDFVTFELTLKNNESKKYKIESITDNNTNNNIKTEYSFNKDYISTGDTSKVTLKLTYKNKLLNVDQISLNDLTIKINLVNEDGDSEEIIINPTTGDNIFHYLVLLIVALVGIGLIVAKKKIKGIKIGSLFVVLAVVLLPLAVFANEKYEIKVKFNDIVIKGEYETYSISIDPGNGAPVETRQITYGEKLGDLPANPTKDGYTFDKWVDEEGNEVTKDTVITKQISVIASYNIVTYNISYDLDDGSLPSGKSNPETYTIESQSISLNNPEKRGYTFAGWSGTGIDGQTTEVTIDHGSIGDRSYKAHYLAKDDTKYTVIHKFEKLGDGYDEETVVEHGTTGSIVPAPRKTRTGFVTPTVQNVTIEADESASVTYVYDRETYAFSITDRTYVDSTSTTDGTYPYGTSITVKAVNRPGYGFAWSDGDTNLERTFELTGITSLTPEYTADENTPYTVKHYKMDLDGVNYTIADTQNLSGTTDSPISPAVNTYEGFTSPAVQSTTIGGDGHTVVNYYYTRNQVTVTFTNTEYIEEDVTSGLHYYGEQITLTAKTRDGYTFTGWTNGETSNPLTITVGTSDIEIGPLYKSDGYTVTYNANGGNFYDSTKLKNIVVYTEKQDQTDGKYETEDKYLNPTKTDNAFKGWYTDSACTTGNEFDIDTVSLTGDIEVYAKWQEGTAMFIEGNKIGNALYNGKINPNSISFSRSTTIPEEYINVTYLVSTEDSDIPIYMWYEEDTGATKWYSDVTKAYLNPDSSKMFNRLQSIETIDMSGVDTSNVTNMNAMFWNCSSLEEIDLSSFDTSKVTDMSSMFGYCSKLEELDITHFDTRNVTNMQFMFGYCEKLTELDITHFDTSKVTNMQQMFAYCSSLESLDVTHFDTGKVINMRAMFNNCSSLEELDLSSFDTSKVINMQSMFSLCRGLESLDLNHFDTSSVTNMVGMFYGCSNLEELNINHFNTSEVTDMSRMFNGCSSLTELDLSSFDTSKVTKMGGSSEDYPEFGMFGNCTNLDTIKVSDAFVTNVVTNSNNMFYNCTSLVGGKGTVYDTNHIDKEYAHIDGGTSNPGYFTSNITEYTVTFNSNGGGEVSSITVEAGETIQSFTTPTAPLNKIFDGWYTELDEGTKVTAPYAPESNITLYAHWIDDPMPTVFSEPGECIFNGSSGVLTGDNCSYADGVNKYIDTGINLYNTENHDKDYEIGFTIVSYNPTGQERQATFMNTKLEGNNYPGLVFRRRDNYDNLDFSSRKTSSANERKFLDYTDGMKVKIYRIYNADSDVQEIFYSINDGEKVKLNDLSSFNPTFDLSVWFGAAPTDVSATAAQRILVNTTLSNMYIKLGTYHEEESNNYTVTLNPNGGSVSPTSITVNNGDAIGTLPTPTAPAGKTFIGWFTGLTDGLEVTSTYIPSGNMTIYARYTDLEYTVTFDTDGGTAVPSQTVNHGGVATRPATDPTSAGKTFDDWYTTDEFTTKFDFDTPITEDTTIYAKFDEDICKTFSTDSWSTIVNNLESDSSYYGVGCEKEVELDMDDDGTNESYTVRLANTSTPEVCSTEGYSQTACGLVIEFLNPVDYKEMNSGHPSSNEGGWKETELVTYLNTNFYNKLPSDLKSVIIPTYPIVSGSGQSGISDDILATDIDKNKIYLLSYREVGFEDSRDNKSNVLTDTRTLDYYVGTAPSGDEIKREKYGINNGKKGWWLRNAINTNLSSFGGVYTTGTIYNDSAYTKHSVAPAFRIGTMPEFTVSFDTDGGSSVASQSVNYGELALRPILNPTKTNYTFDDWYTTDEFTTKFDFDTPITSNTTIYAHFEELKVCANNENITRLSENTCSNNENITVGDGIVCKRAVKLHEETCSQTDGTLYCSGAGYTESGSKGTSTITYGNCGTSGTLSSGDAFTCDVNGDGTFDELTERFYYVSDYYDTSEKTFDTSTAVLIYYNNVTSGVSCNKNAFEYDSNTNYNGPRTLVSQLPTTSQWSNISLKSDTRAILAEYQSTHDSSTTSGGTLPTDFSYEGYAARLLTAKELMTGCNLTEVGRYTTGELDNCNYVMENTKYAKSTIGSYGPWLETPHASNSGTAWSVGGHNRYVIYVRANFASNYGARPAIEVLKSKISY